MRPLLSLPTWAQNDGESTLGIHFANDWIIDYENARKESDPELGYKLLQSSFLKCRDMRSKLFVAAASQRLPVQEREGSTLDSYFESEQVEKSSAWLSFDSLELVELPSLLYLLAGARTGHPSLDTYFSILKLILAAFQGKYSGDPCLAVEMLGLALVETWGLRKRKRISDEQIAFLSEHRAAVRVVLDAMAQSTDGTESEAIVEMRVLFLAETR